MPIRTTGGVFDQQVLTGSLAHYVVCGADFSGAINSYGLPEPYSAAEIIFTKVSEGAYINIMNPNEYNLSFALEAGRSTWDEVSLTMMVQSLGNDVGTDHVDCSACIVKRVPYIWGCGMCSESFLDLTDTPASYAGAANYVVTVNPSETGLIFSPVGITSNAFSFVDVAGQDELVATGSDTLTFVAGSNIILTTDALTNSLTINSTGGGASNDYIATPSGITLLISQKYYVTTAGTVTLPALTLASVPGTCITIAKMVGIDVLVNAAEGDMIDTDLGTTDALDMDVTEQLILICRDDSTWDLQIGSTP